MAGEGREEEAGSQKSKDDEGGSVRLAKNPYIIVSDSNPIALFDYVAKQLNRFGLALSLDPANTPG